MTWRSNLGLVVAALLCGAVIGACTDGGGSGDDVSDDEGCPGDPFCEHECSGAGGLFNTCEEANCEATQKCQEESYTGCKECVHDFCAAAVAELAPSLTTQVGGCDIAVRFDDQFEPIAFSSSCGDYQDTSVGEAEARMMSECCSEGQLLSPAGADAHFVFYVAPGDPGGVSVISNHLVTRMFESTIVPDGPGEISYPTEWISPEDWGKDCTVTLPEATSYELVLAPGAAIDPMKLESLLRALADTAVVPAIISANNTVHGVVVLAYPHSDSTAEYVVLLEAGT